CPRLGPPVAPAKSGTKTSELRAAPGSASRRRHRTHQTMAPVGIMSASRFQPHSKQARSAATPQYWPRHSTRQPKKLANTAKRQEIANWPQPEEIIANPEERRSSPCNAR